MKARKRPVEIEFYPCEKQYVFEIMKWTTSERPIEQVSYSDMPFELLITTLEWKHSATENDVIIKWIHWEVYPCKKDIFEKTYEII